MKNLKFPNCAKSIIVVTFICTSLSVSVFSQGPTTKFPDVNGVDLLMPNDTFQVTSHFKLKNVSGTKQPGDKLLAIDQDGNVKEVPFPPEKPMIKPPPHNGGSPVLTAQCLAIKGRRHGSNINNINLCDEATTNLGIGTEENTFPTGVRFAVIGDSRFIGTITACTLRVDLTGVGCDYVFEKGYKKEELDYVKAFTEKYNHLPGVKSAREMIKKGLNVSEMFTTLLKKIEEIFLHLFDFDKALQGLNDAVDDLFENDKAMEKKIDKLEKQNKELNNKVDMLVERVYALEEK
ncbi:MAG: hypothetical protein FVQ77_13775 [Cytophagales bacterium]|nr:hypothetical protein [Cytophagales bacterium]